MKPLTRKRIPERRAHARFDREVELQGPPGEDGTVARMITRNLSLGGLFCVSPDPIPEMARVAVRLMLPDGETGNGPAPVDVEAVVVRSREVPSSGRDSRFELGLYFTTMSDASRERLARFLASA